MKIIGVTGKSGAGKTSFTEFLNERENVGVIHLDNLLNEIKEEKFSKQIVGRNKDNSPRMLSTNIRMLINNNKILFKTFMLLKKALMRGKLQEQIDKLKREGKDAVIIEGIHLKYMTDSKMYDKVIYIKRPYVKRRNALIERDNISKADLVERDLPYKRKFSRVDEQEFDYVIENSFGKEELRNAAQRIYDEVVGIKSFDEKYIVERKESTHIKPIIRIIQKDREIEVEEKI